MNLPETPTRSKPAWQAFARIIAASALAHLWCLGSQFFMDDGVGIVRSELIPSRR
ncbi:MAG: hypothetical protein WEB53_07660 [Akkermansiaceae bacterium]